MLRLVLVAPRFPGNVGACARLCANFGVGDWVIVDPQCAWDNWDARKLATGSAREKLDKVRVVGTVAEAVADCQAAIGFSRRVGRIRAAALEVSEAAQLAQEHERVAFVFGNEETGLTQAELEPCTHRCMIPTAEDHASLNLSHAVSVALAAAFAVAPLPRTARAAAGGARRSRAPAKLAEFEGLMCHWREFLLDLDLNRAGNPERLLVSFRAVFERAALTPQEVRAIRGVLAKGQVRIGTRVRGKRAKT
jgi:TrmH family RNA methyltransferase